MVWWAGGDISQACGSFYDAVVDGTLAHIDQEPLAARHRARRPAHRAMGWPRAVRAGAGQGIAADGANVRNHLVRRHQAARDVDPPAAESTYTGTVKAVLHTSVGDLTVNLDAEQAPCTVQSFASLAEQGYYDDTSCHRQGNDPGFEFLQCGDPNFDPKAAEPAPNVGSGGPGYTIPDEISARTLGSGRNRRRRLATR